MKMISRYIKSMVTLVAIIVSCSFSLSAENNFNDRQLFDLKGDVKKCVIKTKSPIAFETKPQFTADGELKSNSFARTRDGKVLGSGMAAMGKSIDLTVEYGEGDKPVKFVETSNVNGRQKITINNKYDGERLVGREVEVAYKKGVTKYKLEYSDETYDGEGNWISRKVKESKYLPNTQTPQISTYTELREITY